MVDEVVEEVGTKVQECASPSHGERRRLIACDCRVHQERQLDRRQLGVDLRLLAAHAHVHSQQLAVARGDRERSDQILDKREDSLYPLVHRGSNGCNPLPSLHMRLNYSSGASRYLLALSTLLISLE